MAKAKYFTQNNEKVYPISHTKAVYDGNGKVLEDRLTEDENAISSLQTGVKGKADKTDVDNKLNSNSAISDTTVAFTEASARENIVSNEKSSTLFGKVQKWFSDLKTVAFTGSYNDLIDTPSNATSDTDGFMSKEDKSTVDSLDSTFLDTSSAKYNFLNLLKWNSSNNKIVEIDNRNTPVYYGGNELVNFGDLPESVNEQYDGLMLSTDKIKLDGIAENANNYTHPSTSGNKHIPSGGSSGQILKWSADGTAIWGTEKTYSNATTSSPGLMSATDKIDLDACVETLGADASMFLSLIKSPASAEFEFDETLSLSNLTLTGDVVFSDANLFNGYASLTEITLDLYNILQKNIDNGLDFINNMAHYNPSSGIRFEFTSSEPVYLSTGTNKTGKWYYDGNEIATKSDIPSTSDFLKTSGGTLTGNITIKKNNSSYGTKINLGDGDYVHIAEPYDDAMELKGSNIHLGIDTSKAVWLQSSNTATTKYKVVGTSTGYNTKIHVATSQPSTMSVGDIWFKIPS